MRTSFSPAFLVSLESSYCIRLKHFNYFIKEKKSKKKNPFQATCPVLENDALEDMSVAYKGKKIYLCCPDEFQADPKAFAAKANFQLLQTGQIVQVACPLSGHDLDPNLNVKVNGVKIGLCCKNCKTKLDKASESKKLELVFTSLEKGFTLQTKCPVTDKTIDPQFSLEYKKKTVYFCCKNCPAAFKKNLEKYVAKLPQFVEAKKK